MNLYRFAALAVALVAIVALLVIGHRLLVPLAIALFIWLLINAIASGLERIPKLGPKMAPWLRTTLASVIILSIIALSAEIIIQSVNQMVARAPEYQERMKEVTQNGLDLVGLQRVPNFADLFSQLDLQPVLTQLGQAVSAFATDFSLVVIYIVFLLIEQNTFQGKWRAMFKTDEAYENACRPLNRVTASISQYVFIKTLSNLLTAILCWGVMIAVSMDFALFWAFLIFLMGYIPNIGNILSVVAPGLFAVLQYESLVTVGVVVVGIMAMSGFVGYVVEPRMLGRTLNISPLVILISLTVWGAIWGVMGMILSVPIMVSLMIVFSVFPGTRPVAIWLSENGIPDPVVEE